MKRFVLFIIILLTICIVTAGYLNFSTIYSFVHKDNSAYMTVKELKGSDTIYVDNKDVGNTPLLSFLVTPGVHEIKIKKTNNPDKYYALDTYLSLEKDTNTYINLQLGPNKIYSFYEILLPTKTNSGNGIIIKSDTIGNDAKITIDGKSANLGNFIFLTKGQHNLMYNEPGYISTNDIININEGYVIIDTLHPFRQPI